MYGDISISSNALNCRSSNTQIIPLPHLNELHTFLGTNTRISLKCDTIPFCQMSSLILGLSRDLRPLIGSPADMSSQSLSILHPIPSSEQTSSRSLVINDPCLSTSPWVHKPYLHFHIVSPTGFRCARVHHSFDSFNTPSRPSRAICNRANRYRSSISPSGLPPTMNTETHPSPKMQKYTTQHKLTWHEGSINGMKCNTMYSNVMSQVDVQ